MWDISINLLVAIVANRNDDVIHKQVGKVQKMLNFLFWNTHGNQIYDQIIALTQEKNTDLIILAECKLDIPLLIGLLNSNRPQQYESSLSEVRTRQLVFIHNSAVNAFRIIEDGLLGSFGVFNTDEGKEVIIAAVHFPSKRDRDDLDFHSFAEEFRKKLENLERVRKHSRSVIVGDFNMNPFEDGMIAAKCLHTVMDCEIAKKRGRIVQGNFYKYLYNPMWGRMGDTSPGPSGTYFYQRSAQRDYFWHTFDQVLIRPDLLPAFPIDKLEVVQSVNATTLWT